MTFKPFDQVLEPDVRHSFQLADDPEDPWRKITFREYYDLVAAIELPFEVHEDVRAMFDRARHAVVYSWFDYELTALAEQYALQTLELALRLYYSPAKRTTLGPLIRQAVRDGIFDSRTDSNDDRPPWLARLRNHHAHGSNSFGTPLTTRNYLRTCADLIGRLTKAEGEAQSPPS